MTTLDQPRVGSPRSAFAHRAFRWVFLGSFASNIGTWMQNVALLAFATELGGPKFAGIVTFAQLGPMLFLSPFGGVLADAVNRKFVMINVAAIQLVMSIGLALVALGDHPSKTVIVLLVLTMGIAASANAPAAQATLPSLVDRADLAGAVSLNSAQMNASRVLGPLLAVIPFLESTSTVFFFNAGTYVFVIAAVALVDFDGSPPGRTRRKPLQEIVGGISEARRDPVIGRALATVAIYSLFSLVFIYQMNGFAKTALGITDSTHFRFLFGCFGLGAAIGAIAVGTGLRAVDRTVLVRVGLGGFAVSLGGFALLTSAGWAYPLVGVTGFFYFIVITALSTAIQHEVSDAARGRVMGLWMMAWAGLVPVGSLLAGYVLDDVGYRTVLLIGAGVAAALIWLADLRGATAEPPDPAPQLDSL